MKPKSRSHKKTEKVSSGPRIKPSNFGPRNGGTTRQSLPDGLFLVEGEAAVTEYLRFRPESVKKIFSKERQAAHFREVLRQFRVEIVSVPDTGTKEAAEAPATPIWAHVEHRLRDWTHLEDWIGSIAPANNLILALDHISDPRNLGAIVRSAAFFGVKHVIVPERRQVLLTQSAVATAQGGFALTDLIVVVNLSRALEALKQKDFWILGAAMAGEELDGVRGRFERQVLVLGSEDKGISPNVLAHCDVKVSIHGAPNTLDSLNVSVAAGILLQRLVQLP